MLWAFGPGQNEAGEGRGTHWSLCSEPLSPQIPLAHQSLKLSLADEWNGLGTVDDIKPA